MMLRILLDLIGERDVEEMRVSEAKELVAEFYMRVELLTLGGRGNSHADYYAEKALESCGLGFLAA